jgi:hypothetical protein
MHEGLLYVVARSGLYFSILGVLRWRVNKSFNTLLLNDMLLSFSALKISASKNAMGKQYQIDKILC